jgi:LCP family protein required for cell wall assembly
MTRPFTVLLIGSDQSMLTEHRSQADAIIAVRVDPTARTLTLMTLPGFLVLDGDGEGPPLSEVFRTGGAPGLVDAVQSKLGIPLSAYFQVTFRGLVDMVDAVGGINLSVETTVRDQLDGLNLGASQCAHLDGTEVLEVLRSRHMEVLNPGGDSRTQWIEDRSGDFGREARQRAVLSALVPQLRKLTSSMSGFDAIVSLATDHLTIDSRIGLGGLRALAEWFTSGPSPTGSTAELPVQDHTTSDRHVVLVPAEGAAAAIGSMGGDISTAQALQSGHTPTSIPESAQPFGSCT